MESKNHFCKELIKWGYSVKDGTRVWDISSSKLWYLTPELAKGYLKLLEFEPFKKNVFDVEVELLKQNMGKIVEESGKKEFNMIDLDCSDGYRSEIVAKSIPSDVKARYCLVDSGSFFLASSLNPSNSFLRSSTKSSKCSGSNTAKCFTCSCMTEPIKPFSSKRSKES